MKILLYPFALIGNITNSTLEMVGGLAWLFADATRHVRQALFTGRGRRLAWANLWAQMDRVGIRAIPIVSLVLFCIGSILALQMAPILASFGMVSNVADIISVAIFRELGPLVSAIVLTGFAGASIAAEMGTMVVSEEIEALEAEAISPIRFLVIPRLLATTVMTVCVTVVGNLMGILGGLIISLTVLDISASRYTEHTFNILKAQDFLTGLIKAGVFGALIAGLACYLGLNVRDGAQGVGNATTRTVVLTIVSLIAVDLLFTAVFYFMGW